ncbi:hypothetical protein MKX03_032139 [Papaver bracteatum]|nr:hypothetical protein MKX03_032139 [Papaver bracteatum]
MAKLRGKEVVSSETNSDDDFQNLKKKNKIEEPTTTKDGAKPGTSKGCKTDATKLFRVNFVPLHDLFHDLENRGQMLNNELIVDSLVRN